MKSIWLITVGEPLPIGLELANKRMLRTGILSKKLAARGHYVTWWSSTFNHTHKTHYSDKTDSIITENGCRIILLHGISYSKNISIRRIVNHYQVAKAFERLACQDQKPDIIFCSYPTIELSLAAVNYGQRNNVPVIIDIRDLWPDIFLDVFPAYFRCIGKLLLEPYMLLSRRIFQTCSAITAVSEGYLEWGLRRAGRNKQRNDTVHVLGYERIHVDLTFGDNIRSAIAQMGIDRSRIICWFVGTFGRTYDLEPIIEAARMLDQTGRSNIQFVFSGDGENNRRWRQLAEGLSNVVFTGWINSQELAYLLSIADIGLMAYAKGAPQGFPNKIFEYLSAGIPIISSLQGETASFLSEHECGMTYEPGSSISFLHILQKMLIVDYRGIGDRGKFIFDKRYSASVVYDQLVNYLENMGNVHS